MEIFICFQLLFNKLNASDFSCSSLIFFLHLYFGLQKEEKKKLSKEKGISNLFQVFIPGWYCYHLTSCIYT